MTHRVKKRSSCISIITDSDLAYKVKPFVCRRHLRRVLTRLRSHHHNSCVSHYGSLGSSRMSNFMLWQQWKNFTLKSVVNAAITYKGETQVLPNACDYVKCALWLSTTSRSKMNSFETFFRCPLGNSNIWCDHKGRQSNCVISSQR